jgi:tricorn protease
LGRSSRRGFTGACCAVFFRELIKMMDLTGRACVGLVLGLAAWCGGPAEGAEVDLPRFPSVSPDGTQVVFSWRGDLWRVGIEGGDAVRLTAHPADEQTSVWSPDGAWIAFESTRSGRQNIHVMRPDGSGVRQITFEDDNLSLSGFSADGARVLVSGSVEGDTYRSPRPYWAPVEGGPLTRLHGAFGHTAAASPDGSTYAFVRGNSAWTRRHYRGADNRDVFLYSAETDDFSRLTHWAGNDGQPRWRNKDTLVYLSDRGNGGEGAVSLWSRSVGEAEDDAVRLTQNRDHDITGFDVSGDGRTVVFTEWDGLYTARFGGKRLSEPRRLEINAPADAFPKRQLKDIRADADEAVLSPDGKVLAFVAAGEVFVRAVEDGSPTRRVTSGMARERDIAWSPDMSRLYFVSDRGGTDSIYAAAVSVTREEIRERFQRAINPGPPTEDAADDGGDAEEPASPEENGGEETSEGAADPELQEGGEEPVSTDEKGADKKQKAKVAERWHDAVRFEIVPVVESATDDRLPTPSPDGTRLAFRRERGDVVVLDLLSGEETLLVESWDFGMEFAWSPTGGHIAYAGNDENFNSDIFIAAADGSSEPVNITRHPDNESNPRWSADGKIMAFLSERQGDGYDVYSVLLDRSLEAMTDRERTEYFKDRGDAVKKLGVIDPIDWTAAREEPADGENAEAPFTPEDLEDAYRRLRQITRYPGSESNLVITPTGERMVFRANGGAGGSSGIYSVKWDGSDEKRVTGGGSVEHISRDGSKVVLVSSGRAVLVSPTGGSEERVGPSYTIEVDHEELSLQKFREMARTLGRTFYHPTMKDLDWAGLTEKYAELAGRAYTAGEFAEVGQRLMGELNASHMGVTPGPDWSNPDFRSSGRLGIDATPLPDGGFRVDHVLPRSSTNAGQMGLEVGDVITAIELTPLQRGETLARRLAGRVGDETIVTVRRSIGEGEDAAEVELDLLVTPVSSGTERALRYDDWQLRNARKVAELSGGRLGYLHIRAMGTADLVEYERDLYAAAHGKEGLLIDVRSNGGGWTTDRVLASIMYPEHAYTIPRGAHPEEGRGYPRDRLYIQRFNGPVNMLCNEKSFSNAEIISHAFKTLQRGTLVGQPTHGSVISTGAFTLVDGTRVRQPFRGWYLPDGTDMENNGAVPDLLVEQTPEDEAAGVDRQLEAAVEDLMSRLD